MKISINNLGIVIGFDEKAGPIESWPVSSQTRPKRYYVYGHYDNKGMPFYIGKGNDRRAWSLDRHPLWHRYLNTRLNGRYEIKILADDLSSNEAEEIEAKLIELHSETLVNWQNMGRQLNYALLDEFHKLRNANRKLIELAKAKEKTDPKQAIEDYKQAITASEEYLYLEYENGLVGELRKEEKEELGCNGELQAIDRLTICLVKARLFEEAKKASDDYFDKFRGDLNRAAALKIIKRVSRKS